MIDNSVTVPAQQNTASVMPQQLTVEDLQKQINELTALIQQLGYIDANHASMVNQQSQLSKVKDQEMQQLTAIFNNDVSKISTLLQQGKIDRQKAVEMTQQLKAAYDAKVKALNDAISQNAQGLSQNVNQMIIDKYKEQNPDFFNDDVNNEVVSHLANNYGFSSPNDIDVVANLIGKIKNGSTSTNVAQQGSTQDSQQGNTAVTNQSAISRMVSAADTPSSGYQTAVKVFTRKDISNMSPEDFKANEKAIFEQLKQGLIK